ncbi:MAG: FAD-dependent oxidoreductase [Hyphomonadaceae bacterium]
MVFSASSSASPARRDRLRVAVIGAGVIGLACALEMVRRGAQVIVYEKAEQAGGGATVRAAGMLGLAYESAEFSSRAMQALAAESAALWPEYASRIERLGGVSIDYRTNGAIACAVDEDSERRLRELMQVCAARGVPVEELGGDVRGVEPAISGEVRSACLLPTDGQVDPVSLVEALARALEASGGALVSGLDVERIVCDGRFETPDGEQWDRVLVTTGAARPGPWLVTPEGDHLERGLGEVQPVRGQMLALQPGVGAPARVVRAGGLYIVPKARWTLIGGTSEPGAEGAEPDRAVLDGLRERACRLLGGLTFAREEAAWAGFRPATPDGVPHIGQSGVLGVFVARGHYRNGVLLAPATAKRVADLILEGRPPQDHGDFSPLRRV